MQQSKFELDQAKKDVEKLNTEKATINKEKDDIARDLNANKNAC